MMFQRDYIVFGILVLCFPQTLSKDLLSYRPDGDEKMRKYFCSQVRGCDARKKEVCGYDDRAQILKMFDSACAMLKENCEKETKYFEAKIEACKAKDEFLSKNGNSSVDWAHGHDGFNIPLLNLTKPIYIHMNGEHDFFKFVPGLIKAAYKSDSRAGFGTTKNETAVLVNGPVLHILV